MRGQLRGRMAGIGAAAALLGAVVVGQGTAYALGGSTFYASPAGTGDCTTAAQACSLSAAVGATSAGDTVELADGLYADTGLTLYQGITLRAAAGATPVLAGSSTVLGAPVLNIHSSATGEFDIDGLTISGGCYGIADGGPDLLSLTSTTIENVGTGNCGSTAGISAEGGDVSVDNSVLSDDGSAGVRVGHSTVTITDSRITGSSAGVVSQANPAGTVSVARSTVSAPNEALLTWGTLNVADSTVSSSQVGIESGGGSGSASLTVTDSTVANNTVAGVIAVASTVTITGSTVTGNGIGVMPYVPDYVLGTTITTGADVIAGNTDFDCAEQDVDLPVTNPPTFTTVASAVTTDEGYDIDSDGTCGFVGTGSVSNSSTIAASLGALADNGGTTQTVALADGSPAIGLVTGNLSDGTPICGTHDQRGHTRAAAGLPCDAGAFEVTPAPPPPPSVYPQVTVTSDGNPSVFGQPVSFTASVSSVPPCGVVRWLVDGVQQGDATAVGGPLSLGPMSDLGVGSHEVEAVFSGCSGYGGSSGAVVQVVGKAATVTAVSAAGSTVTATVKPVAPGAGTPTGMVSFAVDGAGVGSAALGADGTATLAQAAPDGHGVSATYAGDADFSGSSGSTTTSSAKITDPTITAHLSSRHPASKAGWYRSPVTVTFTCTAGSAPLTDPGCPGPVSVRKQGGGQSVTGSVNATDGGSASATVSPINIDKSAPRHVHASGATDGATYSFAHRHRVLVCHAKDRVSGIASCTVVKSHVVHKHYKVFTYVVSATNNADATTTVRGTYRTRRKH